MTRRIPILRRLRAASLALLGLALGAAVAQPAAPQPAAARVVTERHFGVSVEDPYRHFEAKADPEVQRWMKAQSEHARATLAQIPGRAAMLDSITRYDALVTDRVTQVKRVPGELYFMRRRGPDDHQSRLVMRQGLNGKEKLLLDPQALENRTHKPHTINWFSPSPDGSLVAFGMSKQGAETSVMSILNTRGGRTLGAPILQVDASGADWSPDGKALVFNRVLAPNKGSPQRTIQTHLLRIGYPVASARPVFGSAIKGLDIGPTDVPTVDLTHDGRWAIGRTTNGVERELGLFIAPQRSLFTGQPQWKRIASGADGVTSVSYFGNTLYLVSHKGAPRSRVLALNLDTPQIQSAKELLAESDQLVIGVAAASDALYIETRDGNVKRLSKRAHPAAATSVNTVEVALPVQGTFELGGTAAAVTSADPRLPGLIVELQSWTRARQVYALGADGSVRNTGLQPAGPYDAPADVVATEVKVKSHDGALVPLSIFHRKGIVLDGRNPTLRTAYASHGITAEPFFNGGRLAWLDAGGVFAVANPRGSGVYGPEWHRGGLQASKPNSWKDFIACAEALIAEKYTQPSRLGVLGSTAGAILVGRAVTERPDLFAAAVASTGLLDSLRFEAGANGGPHLTEFGTVKTEPGFKSLLAMSSYASVRSATPYPALLFTHAVNDPRVEVWQSTKTAARLMAATTSGKPVLLRLEYDAVPGAPSVKQQRLEERADMYSFLLWQMGAAGFQH
jgi:prolyl oligopeptidase